MSVNIVVWDATIPVVSRTSTARKGAWTITLYTYLVNNTNALGARKVVRNVMIVLPASSVRKVTGEQVAVTSVIETARRRHAQTMKVIVSKDVTMVITDTHAPTGVQLDAKHV